MSKRKIEDPGTTTSPPRKLKCKEEDEEPSLDGMGIFQELPQEMFEKIVNYLPCKEKLNLALTSKAMEQAIGTNSSIMKDIVLLITTSIIFPGGMTLGNRRYVNIKFECRHFYAKYVPMVKKDLKKLENSVTSVDFGNSMCYGAAKDMIKMFKNIQKITNFPERRYTEYRKMTNVLNPSTSAYMTVTREQIDRSNEAVSQLLKDKVQKPLNLPQLKFLLVSGTGILNDFENSKLQSLSISDHYGNMFQVTRTKNFLTKQSSLKSLQLISTQMFQEALFKDIEIPFKLNKLELPVAFYSYAVNRDNFQKFINLHRETLTHLTCILPDLHYFHDFRFLKKIEIRSIINNRYINEREQTLPNQLMPFVEILKITLPHIYIFDELIMENFPNLKEFRGKNLSANLSLTHNNIQTLHLESCIFPTITMPNLKVVKFVKISFPANQIPLEESYVNIQEIHLEGCINFDYWLSIFIEHVDTKLKLLELRNLEISPNCYNLIETNAHKIRDTIISNVTFALPLL